MVQNTSTITTSTDRDVRVTTLCVYVHTHTVYGSLCMKQSYYFRKTTHNVGQVRIMGMDLRQLASGIKATLTVSRWYFGCNRFHVTFAQSIVLCLYFAGAVWNISHIRTFMLFHCESSIHISIYSKQLIICRILVKEKKKKWKTCAVVCHCSCIFSQPYKMLEQ